MRYAFIIGGFAGAGKSTAVEILKTKFKVCSSSEYIYKITRSFLSINSSMLKSFNKAALDKDNILIEGLGITCRDLLKHVAEKVLVPSIGRSEGIVEPLLKEALHTNKSFAVESIGGEEFDFIRHLICSYNEELYFNGTDAEDLYINIVCINIRSKEEDPTKDIRKLLEGTDIFYTGDKQLLEKNLFTYIDSFA
jgi:hypothetical protein